MTVTQQATPVTLELETPFAEAQPMGESVPEALGFLPWTEGESPFSEAWGEVEFEGEQDELVVEAFESIRDEPFDETLAELVAETAEAAAPGFAGEQPGSWPSALPTRRRSPRADRRRGRAVRSAVRRRVQHLEVRASLPTNSMRPSNDSIPVSGRHAGRRGVHRRAHQEGEERRPHRREHRRQGRVALPPRPCPRQAEGDGAATAAPGARDRDRQAAGGPARAGPGPGPAVRDRGGGARVRDPSSSSRRRRRCSRTAHHVPGPPSTPRHSPRPSTRRSPSRCSAGRRWSRARLSGTIRARRRGGVRHPARVAGRGARRVHGSAAGRRRARGSHAGGRAVPPRDPPRAAARPPARRPPEGGQLPRWVPREADRPVGRPQRLRPPVERDRRRRSSDRRARAGAPGRSRPRRRRLRSPRRSRTPSAESPSSRTTCSRTRTFSRSPSRRRSSRRSPRTSPRRSSGPTCDRAVARRQLRDAASAHAVCVQEVHAGARGRADRAAGRSDAELPRSDARSRTTRDGAQTLPARVRVHIFESCPGTTLPRLARLERIGGAARRRGAYGRLHPLTVAAAGLLLREPRLGVDVPPRFLESRHRIAVGQRFFHLEPIGAPAGAVGPAVAPTARKPRPAPPAATPRHRARPGCGSVSRAARHGPPVLLGGRRPADRRRDDRAARRWHRAPRRADALKSANRAVGRSDGAVQVPPGAGSIDPSTAANAGAQVTAPPGVPPAPSGQDGPASEGTWELEGWAPGEGETWPGSELEARRRAAGLRDAARRRLRRRVRGGRQRSHRLPWTVRVALRQQIRAAAARALAEWSP